NIFHHQSVKHAEERRGKRRENTEYNSEPVFCFDGKDHRDACHDHEADKDLVDPHSPLIEDGFYDRAEECAGAESDHGDTDVGHFYRAIKREPVNKYDHADARQF
ncbi:MAG: hypothetical protein K0S12_1316, partial [Bacteroidetes bacterium]|nr:hypothetical protein [Bacteroidota bacterium]